MRIFLMFLFSVLLSILFYYTFMQCTPGKERIDPLGVTKVINIYPHDPKAYTQGLVIENDILYEGTGLYKHSSLREVELNSSIAIQKITLDPSLFGEGITVLNDKIYQLTWKSNRCFVYDKTDFRLLREYHYPTQGWGITHNGKYLIVSNGTATLLFYDPDTFMQVKALQVTDVNKQPLKQLNELEFINGEIWANVWYDDRIARIDPETGDVIAWIDLGFLWDDCFPRKRKQVLNGIAYDPKSGHIFVTGKEWPWLFEITYKD